MLGSPRPFPLGANVLPYQQHLWLYFVSCHPMVAIGSRLQNTIFLSFSARYACSMLLTLRTGFGVRLEPHCSLRTHGHPPSSGLRMGFSSSYSNNRPGRGPRTNYSSAPFPHSFFSWMQESEIAHLPRFTFFSCFGYPFSEIVCSSPWPPDLLVPLPCTALLTLLTFTDGASVVDLSVKVSPFFSPPCARWIAIICLCFGSITFFHSCRC